MIFKKIVSKPFLLVGGVILLILIASAAIYFFLQYQKAQQLLTNPNQAAQAEVKQLIVTIGKLIDLPNDEVPTVATVSDKAKLRDQVFFLKAENGDKVLIYSTARKAILYRPSTNRIIDVTSVNINGPDASGDNSQAAPTTSPTASSSTPTPTVGASAKVAIYNGTKTSGLAAKGEKDLMAKVTGVTIISKGNAVNDYADSIVIDISKKQKALAASLATAVGGKVAALPSGETAPEGAEILIILGTSYSK